jgi:hypothetical protein
LEQSAVCNYHPSFDQHALETQMNLKQWVGAIALIVIVSRYCSSAEIAQSWHWNWDSGTPENWSGLGGDTQLTIESGRNGTFGLGATNGPPYELALFPILEITGQDIPPGALVGYTTGEYLPMNGEIFVDTNRTLNGNGNYVDVMLIGQNGDVSRFHSYPYDGIGSIETLGDGWYRHHLANRYYIASGGETVDSPTAIRLSWNYNFDASAVPIVFDNFTINLFTPEPGSGAIFVLGCLLWSFFDRDTWTCSKRSGHRKNNWR